MRPTLIALATIVALALAPVALAGPNEHAAKGQDKAAGARDENATANAHGASGGEHGKKPAFATWHATMKALLTSWLENATKVREDCHAAEKDENATKEQKLAAAHCIRDGYKAFFEHLRADREAARAAAHSA